MLLERLKHHEIERDEKGMLFQLAAPTIRVRAALPTHLTLTTTVRVAHNLPKSTVQVWYQITHVNEGPGECRCGNLTLPPAPCSVQVPRAKGFHLIGQHHTSIQMTGGYICRYLPGPSQISFLVPYLRETKPFSPPLDYL